ncbi:hypothetical protein GP486_003198 [Trichoglossum hirsutum]|uniref:Uncharacterized protein n=1 Tax=Trichoglossum hirsutum TaxID=265104 RepID=A0A9P8LDD2_9PEZI|nr:hypothetical protein GP486_003198 [Trichoglossum hirsutum]
MAAIPALKIPQVTEDDLAAFHAHHFNGRQLGFPGALLSATAPESASLREENYEDRDLEYDDEDDGLGYYPDGVKRTLTDAQIAIFRWSEVQSLLRAKKRRLGDLEGGDLGKSSAESNEKVESKCSSEDASVAREETQGSEKLKERTAYSNVGTGTTLGSKRWKRAKLRVSYDGGSPGDRDLRVTADRENILNYDEVPDPQNQKFPGDVLADESEDEGEYERFLAKEREEFDGTSSSEPKADTGVGRGGSDVGDVSLSSLSHGSTDAGGKWLEQQSPSAANTPPRIASVNDKPPTSLALKPQGGNNGTVPSENTTGDTIQSVHLRRRIFYGDDDGSDDDDAHRPPASTGPTVAVAAGGVTKGEKRAFLWPKVGGS